MHYFLYYSYLIWGNLKAEIHLSLKVAEACLLNGPILKKQNESRYPCTCFSFLSPLCSYIAKVYSQKSMCLKCISFITLFNYLSSYLKKTGVIYWLPYCIIKFLASNLFIHLFLFLVLWDYPPPLSQLFPELTFLLAHFFLFSFSHEVTFCYPNILRYVVSHWGTISLPGTSCRGNYPIV